MNHVDAAAAQAALGEKLGLALRLHAEIAHDG